MSQEKQFDQMTDEQLIDKATQAHAMVHVYGCFGSSDLFSMRRAIDELRYRNYDVFTVPQLVIQKQGQGNIPKPPLAQESYLWNDVVNLVRELISSGDGEAIDVVLRLFYVLERMRTSPLGLHPVKDDGSEHSHTIP